MSFSSSALAISASSFKARDSKTRLPFNFQNPLRCNSQSPPSIRPLSRKLYPVKATLLQENEEEVVVEKSFQTKSLPGNEIEVGESRVNSSSSGLERWVIKVEQSVNIFLTDSVIKILDTLYHDRDYARFFVLETIARVPYFGIGGNSWWFDRFLAQHIAIFYYFMTVFMYALSPRMAYHFSECVESHAFETYDKFIRAHGVEKKPAPEVAIKYYTGGDMYLFDEFQTDRAPCSRRPKIENLYDVFVNIRDDEAEHCKTMKACQTHGNLRSPHSHQDDGFGDMPGCVIPEADCEGIVDCVKKSLTSSRAKQTETFEGNR